MPPTPAFSNRSSARSPQTTPPPAPTRGATTKNAIKNTLVILEKAVDGLPIPGLKAAVGSLVEVIKIIDKAKQNQDALQELISHLRRLGDAITAAFLDHQRLGISSALEARVDRLSGELSVLASDWKQLKTAHKFTHRFINYEDYSLAVSDMGRRIKESLDAFLLENQIASTIVVENIQRAVSKHVLSSEIRSLPRANAGYNSISRDGAPTCFVGTREGVLDDFRKWFLAGSTFMYVLLGIAGVGKSTIAQTIAAVIAGEGLLAASFFFSRYEADRSTSRLFFPSLAFQLAQISEEFATRISRALQASPDAPHQTLLEQLQKLIIEPLEDLPSAIPTMLIVLDALDECEENDATKILQLLLAELVRLPFLKIILTTRPEPRLKSILDKAHSQDGLVLHDIESSVVAEDIGRFLRHQLSREEVEKVLPGCRWACGSEDIEALMLSAGQLFIVASTCDKFIKDRTVRNPQRQLGRLLGTVETRGGNSSSPFAMLDRLYTEILEEAIPGDDPDSYVVERFQSVVGSVVTLQDPLSQQSLSALLGWEVEDVAAVLSLLQSVIVPDYEDPCPRVYHPSFPDFITNPARCKHTRFLIEGPKHHARIAELCLDAMNRLLKRNICGLTYPDNFMENNAVPKLPAKIKAHIPPELTYACSFWAVHLSKGCNIDGKLMKKMEHFVCNNLLFWLEALSLVGRMAVAYPALLHARRFANHPGASSDLMTLLNDAQRLVMSSQEIIKISALHVYHSALPFTPSETLLFRKYEKEASASIRILMGQDKHWDPLLAVLVGHEGLVLCVAFSPDGTRLASSSYDKTIRLWDTATCSALAKLEGHSNTIYSVTFSPNGTHLASASSDQTVRLWDASTGAPVAQLEGHAQTVHSVTFSPDGTRLASASDDNTIRLWDALTGAQLAIVDVASWVRSVAFSPDGSCLASASADKTVRLWNAENGTLLRELEGHSDTVKSVVFSHDGTYLASTSSDKTARIWLARTGSLVHELEGHVNTVNSAGFSPDGTRLASASDDKTIRLWNTSTGALLAKLEGHITWVTSVVFSPDGNTLASASTDRTVRIWSTDIGELLVKPESHSAWVNSVKFSPNGTQLASASRDKTVRLWDAATGAPLAKLEAHSDEVNSASFSPDSTLLASASDDKTIRLWNTATGTPLAQLEGHASFVKSIAFSPDGSRLASASSDQTVRLWDVAARELFATLEGHSGFVNSIAFSPDGTRLASSSDDSTARLWNAVAGTLLASLEGHSDWVRLVKFSPDGTLLASASDDNTVRLWDAVTGAPLTTFEGHSDWVRSVEFSPDGTRLVSRSKDTTVQLWDVSTSTSLAKYTGTLAFTSNRTLTVVQSDGVIQVLWECSPRPQITGQDASNIRSRPLVFVHDIDTQLLVICALLSREGQSFVRVPLCWLPFGFAEGEHDWKGTILTASLGNSNILLLDTFPVMLG